MAYGLPVVTTATGGQGELVDGIGRLVPQRDPLALAEALAGLLASPEMRERAGLAGRRRIEEQFDVNAIAIELVRRFTAGADVPSTEARPDLVPAGQGPRS
jgi:glycosyltransferase involved in cell wall biosynthesis